MTTTRIDVLAVDDHTLLPQEILALIAYSTTWSVNKGEVRQLMRFQSVLKTAFIAAGAVVV